MAHAVHQLAKRRASLGGQRVSGMAQIMKMYARHSRPSQGRQPASTYAGSCHDAAAHPSGW
jgi:hypothetical protein